MPDGTYNFYLQGVQRAAKQNFPNKLNSYKILPDVFILLKGFFL